MITNLLLVFTGLLGLITLFIILFRYKSNRLINLYIAIVIFFFSVRFLLLGVNYLIENAPLNAVIQKTNIYFIFLAPCVYLYFKNLIASQKNFKKSDLFHFVIPLLLIVFNRLKIIENLLKIDGVMILLSIFSMSTITYTIMVFLKLRLNIWNKKGSLEIVAQQNMLIKKWSVYLFVVIVLSALRLLTSLFLEAKTDRFISGQAGIWITSILWLFVFTKMLSTPEILYGYSFLYKKSKENKNYITTNISHWNIVSKLTITNLQDLQLCNKISQNIEKYIEDIDNATAQNNYFRDSKFKLADFALKLHIPKSHLSYLYKYHSQISFSDYKKIARIQNALQLIQTNYLKTNTFDSLAKEVGFSSYNPFFTSFKDIIGKPPQEYCASLEQQL